MLYIDNHFLKCLPNFLFKLYVKITVAALNEEAHLSRTFHGMSASHK